MGGALFRNFALCVKRAYGVRQVYRKSYIYGWKSFFYFLGPLYKSCT